MSNGLPQVYPERLYRLASEGVSQVNEAGTFGANSQVWTTVSPRARVATHSPLQESVSALLPSVEEVGHRSTLAAGKVIAYGAKALGTLDDAYGVGQHVVQGNGAEAVTSASKAGGAAASAYASGKAIGLTVTPLAGPFIGGGTAVVGASVSAFLGGEAAESLAETLTGGPTPDKLGPPLTLPNHLKLDPAIVTAEGDRFALVNVEGKYSWFAMHNDPALPHRYIEVVRGAKVNELTRSYLDAAGFPEQVERHNAEVAEQRRNALRDQFRRSETRDAERLGPDGKPWGKATRTAPNATGEWSRSPQPGEWLHTTRVQGGNGIETRIEKVVNPRAWQVTQETVHADGKLLSTADLQSGTGWKLNPESGQMERFTLSSQELAMRRLPPPLRDLRSMDNAALQAHHRLNAGTMAESLGEVKRLAQLRSPTEEALPCAQRFRQAASELWNTRLQMLERGMPLPDAPGHAEHITRHPSPSPAPSARSPESVLACSASESAPREPSAPASAPAPGAQGLAISG